jgi:flagellar M-ring protein FliF
MEWPLKRKIALVAAIVMSVGLIAGVVFWSERIDYQVLYSNLSAEDAGQVVGKLKEMKIVYRAEGNVIFVPSSRVYDLRLELAAMGIPQGGGVGYEIFDKTQFGVTEFVQKLNYRRALQGEIARTIKQLSEVDQCRVHIAIPERTVFTEKEERPSASVVLKLKAGRVLNQDQIGGIAHLVSSSVEGLQTKDIAVIDNMGNLLSKVAGGGDDSIADSKQIEFQRNVNKEYESRLQSMLEGITGKGKAIVRVTAKIDFAQVERTEEKYDPDSIAVRNEQRTTEKNAGQSPGGIPGVLSNQPAQTPQTASAVGASSQKQSENINYEVSRSISKIVQPRGEVKNISVAVLVDGTYKKEGDKSVYVPRTDSELKKYEDLIKGAVGFNKDRGDQVVVENISFETPAEEVFTTKTDYMSIVTTVMKYVVPLLVVLIMALFVIKPVIEMLKTTSVQSVRERPGTMPELAEVSLSEVSPLETIKENVLVTVKSDPRKAAAVLKDWLTE